MERKEQRSLLESNMKEAKGGNINKRACVHHDSKVQSSICIHGFRYWYITQLRTISPLQSTDAIRCQQLKVCQKACNWHRHCQPKFDDRTRQDLQLNVSFVSSDLELWHSENNAARILGCWVFVVYYRNRTPLCGMLQSDFIGFRKICRPPYAWHEHWWNPIELFL